MQPLKLKDVLKFKTTDYKNFKSILELSKKN